MHLPNYKNGSIVNLMSSLMRAMGGTSKHVPLKGLQPEILAGKSVVLVVIDGLGYEFLKKYGKGSFLLKNCQSRLTSVFPSTTATALTTFSTGLAPCQHAMTGWFMYLKEIGKVMAPLPFTARGSEKPVKISRKKAEEIFDFKNVYGKISVPSFAVTHKKYGNSGYQYAVTKGAKKMEYGSLGGFLKQLKKAVFANASRKFVYAYWPGLDSIGHKYGLNSQEAIGHFKKIDAVLSNFVNTARGAGAKLIITADHGLIDTLEKNKRISLKDHPELSKMLKYPLCGGPRVAYCYVKAGKARQFEKYMEENLKNICTVYKSKELARKKYFGLFGTNKKLAQRIGDYVLIMKSNYLLKDFVKGEKKVFHIGNHEGMSKEEMYVPLITIGI